jgi:RHS repeat-associated protein
MTTSSTSADTYYVYDYRGDLRYVLQPEYQDNASLSLYAFQYKYDARHNVIEKTWPGADPVKYAYDKANRMIYSQDGVQRQNNRVTFMLYDIQGRLVLQGNCYSSSMPNVASVFVTVTRGTSGGVGTSGYTTNLSLSSPVVEQAHYYDDYNFKVSALGFGNSAYTAGTVSAKGLETGSRIATLEETPTNCYTVNHYDIKGRNTKTVSSNHLSGYETVTTTYGYTDKPMTVTHVHSAPGKATQTEVMTYTYDQADRQTTLTHKLNNNTAVTLQDNTYDNYGRLISRDLLNSETVTYNYNIRNWLTSLSSTNFTESLFYYNSSNQRFDGNISRLTWTTSGTTRGYNFTYDKLDRLVSATYGETNSLQINTNRYSTSYTYDENGNFLTLTRKGLQDGGSYGLIDDLTFTLTGNQVTKIEDAASDPTYNGAFNFKDGASQSNEYTYDKNGNMTKDLNKNISSIQYNSLNLPSKVVFSDGKYMDYVYSATGEKRSVTYNVLSSDGSYTYCDNFIYYNGDLNKILVDGGYISISGTTPTYHYYLKDHLGNNRVVVYASGTVKQVTHYYPFGGFFGESTGSSYQTYKYNGKEFERLISEDWYDYGARHMDGMRFTTMDPMAEKYYSISPYAYCANNPIIAIDLDGREVIDMLPAQSKKQQISKQNFYKRWHDNKNSIILLGHGRDRGKTFRTEGAPFTINANSPYSMAFFLEDNSQTWNISSIASDKVELVLFSCETGSYDGLAENLSKQNDFQNISIFAPSESININPDGSVSIDNNGVWREYLNGKVVNEYSGNTVPGTQEFEYSTTWEKKTNNINWQK